LRKAEAWIQVLTVDERARQTNTKIWYKSRLLPAGTGNHEERRELGSEGGSIGDEEWAIAILLRAFRWNDSRPSTWSVARE